MYKLIHNSTALILIIATVLVDCLLPSQISYRRQPSTTAEHILQPVYNNPTAHQVEYSFPQCQTMRRAMQIHPCSSPSDQGTTTTPILPACATTLLTMASIPNPLNRVSPALICAISQTCLRLTWPTVPLVPFPVGALPPVSAAEPFPASPASDLGPAVLPAPRSLFLVGVTPAAVSSRAAVGGVRSSKVKDRSGRTVTRAGIGVPTT